MDDPHTQLLISEYQANVELWKHDDNLRQQRYGTFMGINSLLLVALSGLVTLSPSIVNTAVAALLISFFGFPVCLMWQRVQARNGEYIRFRRYQLRTIEKSLGSLSTFTNQWNALNKFERIHFENINEDFSIKGEARASSTAIEGRLPLVIAVFWLIVLVSSLAVIAAKLLNYIP